MSIQLQIEVVSCEDLSKIAYKAIISLCSRAFEEAYAPILAPLKGSTHLLGYYGVSGFFPGIGRFGNQSGCRLV